MKIKLTHNDLYKRQLRLKNNRFENIGIEQILSENAGVLSMQLVMTQRKRHSPTERILPRDSFNFPT